MSTPTEQTLVDPCLASGGEAGALLRSIDWSKNPLGEVRTWPTTLRTTVGIMLSSSFAMRVLWGKDLVLLHNDAYRPVLGTSKYPGAMGTRCADSFAELWDVVGPMFARVMAGETVTLEDHALPLDRNGYLEESFFTLSYSPLSDDHGGIGGVLGVVSETTSRILAERRLRALRQLVAGVSGMRTAEDVCDATAQTFAHAQEDVPFALLYLRNSEANSARLVARTGLDEHPSARPEVIELRAQAATDAASWPLEPPERGARMWIVGNVSARFGELHGGPYPEPIASAVVLALSRPGMDAPYGYLVAGVSPRRALDAEYETFYGLAGEHIVAAITNAVALGFADRERQRLRSFLLEAPSAIAVLRGPQLVFEIANAHISQLAGRRSEDLVGKPGREAVPELIAQGVWDVIDTIYATGQPFAAREFPARLDRKGDGSLELGYFDWIAQPTRDSAGAIDGVMLFAVEVTEQVRARRAVEASQQFLETVVNQMPAGVLIAEAPSGRTVLSNALAESILPPGTRPLHSPTDLPIARALAGERVLEEEVVVQRPDGEHRTLLVSAAPVYDADGRRVAGVSSFVDITERKLTELALRDSEERGRAIVAALEEGIAVRGIDGVIHFANASARAMLGLGEEAVGGGPSREPAWRVLREDGTVAPIDEHPARIVLREGRPLSSHVIGIEHPDGRVVWLSINSQPLFDSQGSISGVVSSFFDVTERKSADEERQRLLARAESARSAAESASRSKDEFLAIVSHELRNPLNAMLGWTRMLRAGSLSAERSAKALETIERNATNQAQLIEDLLDVSRVISGKLPLDVQTVTFSRVIEAAIDSARPAIDAKGLRLTVVLDTEGVLSGDPGRLQQIVWNLLTNATKFTPPGGSIRVELRRDGAHLELCVSDSGQGIAPSFLDHVFDRFRQADPSTTRQHGGLGLGLSIAKNLVEMHGGTIEVRSEGVGRGATFIVRVPLAQRHSPSPQLPIRATSTRSVLEHPADLRGLRVLVVDDEPDARDLVTAVLAECGAEVTMAASAAAAKAAIAKSVPDVLISDVGMPGEDGYSLIAHVRSLSREGGGAMPAACLTGYTTVDDRRRALGAGFDMHLAKPLEPNELIAVAANLGRMAKALRVGG